MSTSSEAELENRLHALTESLIHKQTMLESLSTEKNSLMLQLERMEVKIQQIDKILSIFKIIIFSKITQNFQLLKNIFLPIFEGCLSLILCICIHNTR